MSTQPTVSEEKEHVTKSRQKIYIPPEQLYKAHVLNSAGKLESVYVFSSNLLGQSNLPEIFSDSQLAYFKALDVQIYFADALICNDDTIRTVKRKLVQEMMVRGSAASSIDELYLFTSMERDINMNQVYQEATQNDAKPFTKERFFQYALNVGADPFVLELDRPDGGEPRTDILAKDAFTYEDWMALQSSGPHTTFSPMGLQFQEAYDNLFAANPFQMQVWTEPIRFEISPGNPLLSFENTLLLNYGGSTDIMVCPAKHVLEYAEQRGISQEYLIQLYYPFLQKRGVDSLVRLAEMSAELGDETAKQMTSGLRRYYECMDTFRKIYWGRTSDLPYIERGIRTYSIRLKRSDFKHLVPLDALFRSMHVSKEIPFMKYNPGSRRENMYRLYSDKISANGKKIPVLPEPVIMRLSRETGKGNQISMYVKAPFQSPTAAFSPRMKSALSVGRGIPQQETDGDFQEVYIHIDANSSIHITGTLSVLMDVATLDEFLRNTVTPILQQINGLLQASGYSLRTFRSLSNSEIDSARFTYQALLPIEKSVKIAEQMAYITNVFDVISEDVAKGAVMRYKRVDNFREMDAQDALITEIYQRVGHYKPILQALIDNYRMTEEEATLRLAAYSSEHQEFNGKILDNPGFPVLFKMQSLKNEILVEVGEIISAEYLSVVPMYLDVVLRMTQDPTSTSVSAAILKHFRTKPRGNAAVLVDEGAVSNVIAPIGFVAGSEFNAIQPMRFLDEEGDEGEEGVKKGDIVGVDEGGFSFDEDYDYEEEDGGEEEGTEEKEPREMFGGAGSVDGSPDASVAGEKYVANIDGMSLKHPTPFFRRMQELDPTLFLTQQQGKFKLYSRSCPSDVKRQPVILTDEEKEQIDKTNPGSYNHAIQYGSNPKKKFWYICPRFWCMKTNSSISEEDVKAGKCGGIIPANAKVVPPGAYVYEFSHPKEHIDNDGNYIPHVPGFLDKDQHPNGMCIPCCFKKKWDSRQQVERRDQCRQAHDEDAEEKEDEGEKASKPATKSKAGEKLAGQKMITYIIGSVSYPLPERRWGFLPMAVQYFLRTDNSATTTKQNAALIRPNTPCLLRYGVEQTNTQSFMGCIAHFYAYKQNLAATPSIQEMRGILAGAISIDLFVRYQNGNLATIFRPKQYDASVLDIDKYSTSEFYKSIDLNSDIQVDHLEDTIAAYESFLAFLQDDASSIDHTYLWDIVCDRNPLLMRDGINLVILKMADDDITEKVQMVCPSNSYSAIPHDPSKETVILIKQEEFYEPIHMYEEIEGGNIAMKKAFLEGVAIKQIQSMLALIKQASKKYCAPQPSMPRTYKFKRNLPIQDLIRSLKTHHYRIESQIVNYRNKAIGLRVNREEGQDWLFVPSFPSGLVEGLKTRYMDEDGLWLDYRMTRDRLHGISSDTGGKIPCQPMIKIVEDGMVVGFLTETNQFVQINPPHQPLEEDGLDAVYHSSYAEDRGKQSADTILATSKKEDEQRVETIRRISLETQFYNVFRSTARLLLNEYEHRNTRKSIQELVQDVAITYHNKLAEIERMLRALMKDAVSFQVFDDAILAEMDEIMTCQVNEDGDEKGQCSSTTGPQSKYCFTTEKGGCQTIFPKRHLLSGSDNERVYFGRLADELLRYRRIQIFMFQSNTYLNMSKPEFRIREDELFLLESLLNHEYFRELVPYNVNPRIQHIEYDTANPAISQTYSNEISLAEQVALMQSSVEKTAMSEYILDCIRETRTRVIGNDKAGSWRPIFPPNTKEMIFGNTVICSYIPMIYILQEIHKKMGISVQNVKVALWNGYAPLMELYGDKIIAILRKQGKRAILENVRGGNSEQVSASLERILFSDEYYITDLDWWVFARVAKLPVILFSTTTLKYLLNSINWLKLGGSGAVNEAFFFVRSPVDVRTNAIPAYHVLTPAVALGELRNDMFLKAERGDAAYTENMQNLDEYLAKLHIIGKKA